MRVFGYGLVLAVVTVCSPLRGQPVTFGEHVAPIIYRHCTPCHQPGGSGPMPFTSYLETVAYGAMIDYVTRTGYMPPWRADAGYGTFDRPLALPPEDVARIGDWAAAGFPRGPELSADAWRHYQPRPQTTPDWDLELAMAESFEQYDIYFDQYQVFRLPTGLEEGRWVAAVDFVPGDSSLVRYVSVSVNTDPAAASLDAWDPRYGYTSFGGPGLVPDVDAWFTWAPGDPAVTNAPARWLPAGAELLLFVHYGPSGERKTDRSRLRLRFTDVPPGRAVSRSVALFNPTQAGGVDFSVPAGREHWVHATVRLPVATTVFGLEPHGLLLANAWEVYARTPAGHTVKLLKVSDYDVHWRREYRPGKPVAFPAGTVLHARARYDNRPGSPQLPADQPLPARWGATIFDEQFLVRFRLTLPDPEPGFRILPTAGNQRGENRTVHYEAVGAAPVRFRLVPLGAASNARDDRLFPLFTPASGSYQLSLLRVPPGTYYLQLEDEAGHPLAADLLVYWPEKLTKTLLDD